MWDLSDFQSAGSTNQTGPKCSTQCDGRSHLRVVQSKTSARAIEAKKDIRRSYFGWLGRPFESRVTAKRLNFDLGIVDGISGVHTGPGATPFTRMLWFADSLAIPLVRFTSAALVAA